MSDVNRRLGLQFYTSNYIIVPFCEFFCAGIQVEIKMTDVCVIETVGLLITPEKFWSVLSTDSAGSGGGDGGKPRAM